MIPRCRSGLNVLATCSNGGLVAVVDLVPYDYVVEWLRWEVFWREDFLDEPRW